MGPVGLRALWALWMGEKAGVWSAASVKAAGDMSRIAAKKYVKILRLDGCSCKQGSCHPVWQLWQHRARLWTTESWRNSSIWSHGVPQHSVSEIPADP